MNIPAFTLYGLIGCSHCADAEKFLVSHGLGFNIVIVNEDPIATTGIKQVTGEDAAPVLVYKLTKEILKGFVREDYERVANDYYSRVSASTPSIFGVGQQSQSQVTSEAKASTAN